MPRCDHCGSDSDRTFDVVRDGDTWTFDSFQCAIDAVAPRCPQCNAVIVGHGVEQEGRLNCTIHRVAQTDRGRPAADP